MVSENILVQERLNAGKAYANGHFCPNFSLIKKQDHCCVLYLFSVLFGEVTIYSTFSAPYSFSQKKVEPVPLRIVYHKTLLRGSAYVFLFFFILRVAKVSYNVVKRSFTRHRKTLWDFEFSDASIKLMSEFNIGVILQGF